MKVFLYTTLALVAFAFNSILCRLALRGEEADAVGFTAVRLISGAVTLIVISYFFSKSKRNFKSGSWPSAFFLFAYAICFSLAYLDLATGTGALVLFSSVQITMIIVSLVRGEGPGAMEWVGLVVAAGGLVYLLLPGIESPPLVAAALMAAAGIAWGFYTLRGKGSKDPIADTVGNFVRSVPMIAIVAVPFISQLHLSGRGLLLAVLSGAIASGIGYSFWYAALKYHTAFRAAVLQLPVPLLTAVGGIVFLSEVATLRLVVASVLILGGIALTIYGKRPG